jgi:hypothetical protein
MLVLISYCCVNMFGMKLYLWRESSGAYHSIDSGYPSF